MKYKTALGIPYYEIVKYNLRTRKDLEVLPDRFQVLSEVNHEIETLNARLKTSKKVGGKVKMAFWPVRFNVVTLSIFMRRHSSAGRAADL